MTERTRDTILVVDDERGPRESLRMILAPTFKVPTASSSVDALALLRSEPVDIVTVDLNMPGRLGATFIGEDGQKHVPVMLHRALFGSLERFMGILIEHFAGAFPLWLAPVQVRIIPVGLDHREAAHALAGKLAEFRVEVDDSDETVGKRIRNAEVEKIPYVVVWGDKESEDAIAVREHGGEQSTRSLDELVAHLREQASV